MNARKAPADGRILAKLAYPMPLGLLLPVAQALESVYGEGLVIRYDLPDATEWATIANPSPEARP